MRIRLFAVALVAFAVSACDSSSSTEIGGLYVATYTEEGTTGRFTLDVPDTESGSFTLGSRSNVSGQFDGTTVTFDVTGSGQYDHPNITMNLTTRIGGESSTGRVTGTVSESGNSFTVRDEDGDSFTFTRQ